VSGWVIVRPTDGAAWNGHGKNTFSLVEADAIVFVRREDGVTIRDWLLSNPDLLVMERKAA
jgi:hypothetical protein